MKLETEIKQKRFRNIRQKAIINLLYTGGWVNSISQHRLKPFELSTQQFNILRILRGQHPNPVRANDLRDRMLDRMSNTSRLIEKLRVKGLIERHICPNDRRAVDITITKDGLIILHEIDKGESEWENNFSNLSEEELTDLNNLLDKFRS